MKAKGLLLIAAAAIFTMISIVAGCTAQKAMVKPGDPSQSFFGEQVVYPYKVNYADAKSAGGTIWNIGYMDVAPLFKSSPKVLVLIHGRGFNGAYFGHAIKAAHQNGIRVIVPDLPNYGKSIPNNLDNPLVRSMQQTREVIHDLVVNHLGISKATYGGHSLGGQFVLGYALSYPQAVEGLILIAPAGLEELPAKYFPAELVESTNREEFSRFPYYAPQARFSFSTNAKLIEDFFFFRLVLNGKRIPSGFFKKETPDTRLAANIRTGMIKGNPVEFKRHCLTSLRDVYNLGVEIQKEDPSSIFKQYDRIRSPILLIFGEDEPFYPKKISGLKDLKREIIRPFYRLMSEAGCPVAIKLYPGSGHFPHSDMPGLFAEDAVRFVTSGKVQNLVNPNEF